MKNYFILCLLSLCTFAGSAQKSESFHTLKDQISANPKDSALMRKLLTKISVPDIHPDSVFKYGDFLIEQSKKSNFTRIHANTAYHLGVMCTTKGTYSRALYYLLEAEKDYQTLRDYDKLGQIYSTIGNTYLGIGNKEEMYHYFKLCYDLGVQQNSKKYKAYGAGGLGNYYSEVGKYKQSNDWNDTALVYFQELGFKVGCAILTINSTTNYRKLGEISKAKELIQTIEKDIIQINFNYASFLFYKEKGDLDMATNNTQSAIKNYHSALDKILPDNAIHNISEIYESLSEAYEKAGNPQKSLEFLQLHLNYKDSVFNEESNRQIVDITAKYVSEKKDAEIKLLNRENALNKSELSRKKTIIYASIGGGILLAIMLVFFIKANIQKNKTNQLLAQQKIIIEDKQKEILDSINYAKRIQFTLLASDNLLNTQLEDHFVYFEPKDIVSGDFYWGITKGAKSYLAVCDCTGHGVPGAFMSLLNINFLNEAITEKNIEEPGEIFNFVRTRLIENLSSDGSQDGMDGILICVDKSMNTISYAAANNSPLLIHNNEIIATQNDRMPVGKGVKEESFQTFHLPVQKGDFIYLYTDGFVDQFGGEKGKKFMHNPLKKLLLNIHQEPLLEQRLILKKTLLDWKGDLEQVDDICMIGLRV